jgi:hypothetical protein
MLRIFSTISRSPEAPAPSVNFEGVWVNELKSKMTLSVDVGGKVTGKYETGVGAPPSSEQFDLVGFASGDLISFTVNFGEYDSLTSWVGQLTEETAGPVIKTMWLLAKNVSDPDEPAKLWGSVLTGYDNFTR